MDVLILMVYDKCPVDVSRLTWYGFDVLRSTMYGLYAVLVLIQHNAVSYRHPVLHAYTHRAFFASKERPETFDVILSISSFEHHEYRRRKYAEINEYRRRKYAENKEAKNISLKDFSLILIIIMPLSFSAGAPPSSWVPPLLQDGFLAGAIWYTTRRRRCQAVV